MIRFSRRRILMAVVAALLVAAGGLCAAFWPTQARIEKEAERIAQVMNLQRGWTVADVGAGDGRYAIALARRLGAQGRLLATEIEEKKLSEIREAAGRAGLRNVTVIQGGERVTNLPESCCEAILLRNVYHHLPQPAATDASLFRALRPGGMLVVIDFEPSFWLGLIAPKAKGVPADRGGHGVPRALLTKEMTAAGFQTVRTIEDWPGGGYCLLFRRPSTPGS